jgi:hypothetical protein
MSKRTRRHHRLPSTRTRQPLLTPVKWLDSMWEEACRRAEEDPGLPVVGVCVECAGVLTFVERAGGVEYVGDMRPVAVCGHTLDPAAWAYNMGGVIWSEISALLDALR